MIVSLKKFFNINIKQISIILATYFLYMAFVIIKTSMNNTDLMGQRLFIGKMVFLAISLSYITINILERNQEIQKIKTIDLIIKYRYLCAFILFVFLVSAKVHGFSIDMWSQFIQVNNEHATLIFGKNRGIQSDVWAIGIPQYFNQVENRLPLFNTTMMEEGLNTILSGLPALDITLIGQPHLWGFLIGKNIGLSWMFWFKMFALFLTSYEVLNFLVKGKQRLAFLGALIIATSPLMLWWFGHTVNTAIIYAQWSIACVILYAKQAKNEIAYSSKLVLNKINLIIKVFLACCGAIGFIGFVLAFYPALQVPMGYLSLILIFFVLKDFLKTNKFKGQDYIIITLVILVAVIILARFLLISRESIRALSTTVFPGKRFCQGGEGSLSNLFYYIFQPFIPLFDPTTSNSCESSRIVPFVPIVFFVSPFIIKYMKERKSLYISLMVFEGFLISWLFIKYPAWFAKITLLSNVTGARLVWIIGLVSVYLGIIILSYISEYKKFSKIFALSITAIIAGFCLLIIFKYGDFKYLNMISNYPRRLIGIVVLIFSIFNFCFIAGFKRATYAFLIIMCIYFGVMITPLERGSASLYNSEISRTISEMRSRDPDAYWLCNEGFPSGNFLMAHGVKSFNATNQYMDKIKWHKIDPEGKYENVYNRYAQVSVNIVESPTNIRINGAADQIAVDLSTNDVEKLGVNYVISQNDILHLSNDNVVFYLIKSDLVNGQKIYGVKYKTGI